MKGNAKVIDALNDFVATELTGHNQYLVHARMCAYWGYERLAEQRAAHAADELEHTRELIARILFLEGKPDVQRAPKVKVGQTVTAQFAADHALVAGAISRLNKAMALAVKAGDNGSRELLERLLHSEEHLLHWLEAQRTLIRQVGEQNYLAEQIRK